MGREVLLQVDDLHVEFPGRRGPVPALEGVSFSLEAGERLAVVGESGSGKSVTAAAIMGLLRPPGRVTSGSIRLHGRELVGLRDRQLSKVRGRQIALVLQDPLAALNPLKTIGSQIEEALRLNRADVTRRTARGLARDLLAQVRLRDPDALLDQYPHQLSGGMNQRVAIASALACQPELLIADEPTTALDATTQARVLDLLADLVTERDMALLLITHDLGVVAGIADRVAIMYSGRLVEDGPARPIFRASQHPYTHGLLAAVPRDDGAPVEPIPGNVPDPRARPSGCAFHPRCPIAVGHSRCAEEVPLPLQHGGDPRHVAACHYPGRLAPPRPVPGGRSSAPRVVAGQSEDLETVRGPLLVVSGLGKQFQVRRGLFGGKHLNLTAVDGVSFSIAAGETLALVGESGSGKTTTSRLLLGLVEPTAGSIRLEGEEMVGATGARLRSLRRRVQVVFQDPDGQLDPRMRIIDIITEPLEVQGLGTPAEREGRAAELIEKVGLSPADLRRYPRELSGGQKQRVAIARALAPRPQLIICDEPVTALDVSVQAQILNLLSAVQLQERLAYLFVAHDLAVVRQVADRVAVMQHGRIVEMADCETFFAQPKHPYSRELLAAMLVPDPARNRRSGGQPPQLLVAPERRSRPAAGGTR